MTATILPFPPFAVRIIREGDAWLVLAARGHGWLCGSHERGHRQRHLAVAQPRRPRSRP